MKKYILTLPLVSGGRVTIPEAVRKNLNINDGDLVQIVISLPEEKIKDDENV